MGDERHVVRSAAALARVGRGPPHPPKDSLGRPAPDWVSVRGGWMRRGAGVNKKITPFNYSTRCSSGPDAAEHLVTGSCSPGSDSQTLLRRIRFSGKKARSALRRGLRVRSGPWLPPPPGHQPQQGFAPCLYGPESCARPGRAARGHLARRRRAQRPERARDTRDDGGAAAAAGRGRRAGATGRAAGASGGAAGDAARDAAQGDLAGGRQLRRGRASAPTHRRRHRIGGRAPPPAPNSAC